MNQCLTCTQKYHKAHAFIKRSIVFQPCFFKLEPLLGTYGKPPFTSTNVRTLLSSVWCKSGRRAAQAKIALDRRDGLALRPRDRTQWVSNLRCASLQLSANGIRLGLAPITIPIEGPCVSHNEGLDFPPHLIYHSARKIGT